MTLATGWSVTIDSVEGIVSTGLSADAGEALVLVVSQEDGSPIEEGQTVLLSYDPEVGTIKSLENEALAAVVDYEVTNGSTIEVPDIVTATVDASGTKITFTFDREVTGFATNGLTVTSDADPVTLFSAHLAEDGLSGYVITDSIYQGTTVTITNTETTSLTVSVNGGVVLQDAEIEATNNSTREAPTVQFGEVSSSGKRVDVYFTERVSGTADLGWTLYDVTYARSIAVSSYAFTTTNTTDDGVRFVLTTPVYEDSVVRLSYTSATGDLVSHANPLVEVATFADALLDNNSSLNRVTVSEAVYDDHSVIVTLSRPLLAFGTPTGFSLTNNGDALSIDTASYGPLSTQVTLEFTDGIYGGDALLLDVTSSNIVSTLGEEPDDADDIEVDITSAPAFSPAEISGILDYASWTDTEQLAKETSGAWGVVVGDYVQRWKGALGAVSMLGPDWDMTNTSGVYHGRYYYTSTGVRGPLSGGSIDFEASEAITYTEPLVLFLAVRYPTAVGAGISGSVWVAATGVTVFSLSASQTRISSLRNGSASASSITVSPAYPQEYAVIAHTTDATNWGVDDGTTQDTNSGGAPETTNATKIKLYMTAIGAVEGDPDTCPRILAWGIVQGTITANERARLHLWLSEQSAE